jgi:hypothetical protein
MGLVNPAVGGGVYLPEIALGVQARDVWPARWG